MVKGPEVKDDSHEKKVDDKEKIKEQYRNKIKGINLNLEMLESGYKEYVLYDLLDELKLLPKGFVKNKGVEPKEYHLFEPLFKHNILEKRECLQLAVRLKQCLRGLFDNIDSDWEKNSNKSIKDYDERMQKLWLLSMFDQYVDLEVDLIGEIHDTEKELRLHLKENPEKLQEHINSTKERLMSHKDVRDFYNKAYPKLGSDFFNAIKLANEGVRIKNGKCYLEFKGKKWRFDFFAGYDRSVVISESNPDQFLVLPLKMLLEKLENNKFGEVVKELEDNYKCEQEKRAILEKYELPKNEEVSYLRVFPGEYDDIIARGLEPSTSLAFLLEKNYPNLKVHPIIFSDTPLQALKKEIEPLYKKGRRIFYIDFSTHGHEDGLVFKKRLTAKDLSSLKEIFPESKLIFSTIACHGGGLRKGFFDLFKEKPNLKETITAFLQSKPKTPTIPAKLRIKKGDKVEKSKSHRKFRHYSTYFQIFFMEALQKGMKYGEAVIEADQKTKQKIQNDPEAIINGELITEIYTEGVNRVV